MLSTSEPKHYDIFRDMLIKARKETGMSQERVAEVLGWKQSTIAKTENGERRLDVVEYVLLAEAIGFDPAKMLADYRKVISR